MNNLSDGLNWPLQSSTTATTTTVLSPLSSPTTTTTTNLWKTRILTNNDDTFSMKCSQLFTNSMNETSIITNVTNITNTTTSTTITSSSNSISNFSLGKLSQQLNNQSQLFFNETWLLNNLSSDNDINASSASTSSSATIRILNQNFSSSSSSSSLYCETVWDGVYCWPMTASSTILMRSCIDIFDSVGELPKDQFDESTFNNAFAYRICDNNGTWIKNWTNYTECLLLIANNESDDDVSKYQFIRQLVIFIMFTCSMLSLILLLITFFIFTYFRSLTSCRLRVHRNLVVALILHSVCLLLIASPHLFNPDESLSSYWEIEWLCKSILTLKLYSTLASINWMFIEGFQLHSRVTVSILRKDAPFKLYHFLGWGIPLVLVSVWALQMSLTMDTLCWNGYAHSLYIWIIVGPMILALSINCIFLVNIIRVLLTKLRLTVTIEIKQIRKAIKATALLFPLLGISHLLFCINPDDNGRLEDAYLIFNAFLQSSQGIFVSILYCFMDTDVQQALKISYQRTISQNESFPSRHSRLNNSNIMSVFRTPPLHNRNIGSFKYARRKPMIKNIIRTNSLNETAINIQSNTDNLSSSNNKHLSRQNNGFTPITTTTKQNLMNTSNASINNNQRCCYSGTGTKIQSPSINRGLCIMYNSNGEMVRFQPKIHYSQTKLSSTQNNEKKYNETIKTKKR